MYLVLIFGCLFPQNQSAGSYFAMFLFAGFYCIQQRGNFLPFFLTFHVVTEILLQFLTLNGCYLPMTHMGLGYYRQTDDNRNAFVVGDLDTSLIVALREPGD